MEMTEGDISDNRWLRDWIVMEMMEGVIFDRCILVTIRKIIGI